MNGIYAKFGLKKIGKVSDLQELYGLKVTRHPPLLMESVNMSIKLNKQGLKAMLTGVRVLVCAKYPYKQFMQSVFPLWLRSF